jgi:hypothetical protein
MIIWLVDENLHNLILSDIVVVNFVFWALIFPWLVLLMDGDFLKLHGHQYFPFMRYIICAFDVEDIYFVPDMDTER